MTKFPKHSRDNEWWIDFSPTVISLQDICEWKFMTILSYKREWKNSRCDWISKTSIFNEWKIVVNQNLMAMKFAVVWFVSFMMKLFVHERWRQLEKSSSLVAEFSSRKSSLELFVFGDHVKCVTFCVRNESSWFIELKIEEPEMTAVKFKFIKFCINSKHNRKIEILRLSWPVS